MQPEGRYGEPGPCAHGKTKGHKGVIADIRIKGDISEFVVVFLNINKAVTIISRQNGSGANTAIFCQRYGDVAPIAL